MGYCPHYPPSSYGPVLVGSLVFYLLLKAVKLRHQHKQRDLNMLCLFDSRSSDQLQFSFYANIRCPNQVMMEYFLANCSFICSYIRISRGTTYLQDTVRWVDFKWNWKNFQWDLCGVKEYASGIQKIFCLISYIEGHRNSQLGSLAHSAWIG